MHADRPEAERVFLAHIEALEADESFDLNELVARHPNLADALRSLHDDWRRLRELIDATRGQPAAHASIRARFGDGADPTVSLGPTADDPAPVEPLLRGLAERSQSNSRYRLVGEVARGGMGVILKVWDSDLRRHLAMKVILGKSKTSPSPDAGTVARFLEEAQITGQLDHPSIVPVHDLGLSADGRVYFTMRLVRGRNLAQVFEDAWTGADGWSTTRALGSLQRACEALAYAHAKGVVHRDLKPANVMIGRFGEVYVMDWGLARVLGQPDRHDLRLAVDPSHASVVATDRSDPDAEESPLRTADGDIIGTPTYMAPEQALGRLAELNQAADVYSIGAMLYHLLARTPPYVMRDEKVNANIVLTRLFVGPPEPLAKLAPEVAPELISICEKAMARRPADRYANVQELSDDLRAYLEDRVVRAHRTGAIVELRKWMKRNRLASAAILVAIVLAVGGSGGIAIVQANADTEIGHLGNEIAARQAELDVLSSRLEQARASIDRSQAELAAAQNQIAKREGDLAEMSRAFVERKAELDTLTLALTQQRSERDTLEMANAQSEAQLQNLKSRIQQLEHEFREKSQPAPSTKSDGQ